MNIQSGNLPNAVAAYYQTVQQAAPIAPAADEPSGKDNDKSAAQVNGIRTDKFEWSAERRKAQQEADQTDKEDKEQKKDAAQQAAAQAAAVAAAVGQEPMSSVSYFASKDLARLAQLNSLQAVQTFMGGLKQEMKRIRNSGANEEQIRQVIAKMKKVVNKATAKLQGMEKESSISKQQQLAESMKNEKRSQSLSDELDKKRKVRRSKENIDIAALEDILDAGGAAAAGAAASGAAGVSTPPATELGAAGGAGITAGAGVSDAAGAGVQTQG